MNSLTTKKFKLAIGSALLLTVAFVVNSAFLSSALGDGYHVFEIKRFLIPMESASAAIEKALGNNNRRLSVSDMREIIDRQRVGINEYWQKFKVPGLDDDEVRSGGLVQLSIVLKSGSKLVTTASDARDSELPQELVEQMQAIADGRPSTGSEFVEDSRYFYVPYLLFDKQERWIVSVIFQFQKNALRHTVAPGLEQHMIPTLAVGMLTVLGVLLLYFPLAFQKRVTREKDFIFDFVLVMLVSLSCSLLVNSVVFERQILESSISHARETTSEMSARLNERLVLKQSGEAANAKKFDFSDSYFHFDGFDAINLENTRGKTVYSQRDNRHQHGGIHSALQGAVLGRLPQTQFRVEQELAGISGARAAIGTAVIHISRDDIFNNWISMIIKGITILFLTILVTVECLLLYLHLRSRRKRDRRSKSRYEMEFVRPAMFLFLFAIDLSMAIVPLHMKSFDDELFGLSRDIVLGLPISSEFLCVGIFLLVAGVWMDRRGWHEPYFVGLLVVGAGSLFSWMATDSLQFIFSRALVGVGYGLSLMSAQGLVVSFGGKRGRARGFACLFAGLYSGSICGAATGSILAERFGYEEVFFVGAVFVVMLVLFSLGFMRTLIAKSRPVIDVKEKPRQKINLVPLLKFIGNPVFIALSVLSSLPASIAVAGFLHFFTPVYLDQIGARESTIGQVLILYGICLIYFGPAIGRMIDRSEDKKYYMLAGGLLGGLAFVAFNTDFGIVSMIVCVFLLGLSSSFVLSSQSTMVLELKESRLLGEGTALGIFRSISRIGQVVGPVIFGWVLVTGNLTEVINYLGYTYIGAMFVLAAFVMNHAGDLENQKPAFSK